MKKITYTANGPIIEGTSKSFLVTRLMWKELISAQELIWRLAVRDFSSKYRQSILGISWAVIMPLITVALFIGMNKAGILNISDVGIPYPLYALIGLTVWNILTTGLTASSQAIVGAGSMVVKINFPKIALIIASTGQCIIELIIRTVLIGGAFIYFQTTPSLTGIIIGIISLIPFYLFIVGLGFFLSLAGGVLRDISNILTIALSAAMLLTYLKLYQRSLGLLMNFNVPALKDGIKRIVNQFQKPSASPRLGGE